MSEFVICMWIIVLLTALVGGIPYTILIIYSAIKKNWKRVVFLLALPIGIFIVLCIFTLMISEKASYASLFNVYTRLGKPLYEYDSPRAFNGDGYSFRAYELPTDIRNSFKAPDQKLLTEFPKQPFSSNGWSVQPWKEAPLTPSFNQYIEFALSNYDERNESSLSPYFKAIREALSSKGTFYSFFSRGNEQCPQDIDLFIVDLKNNRLYIINHNT